MVHLTSCLLVCLISAGTYVAALQKAPSIRPPELSSPEYVWPQKFVWPPPLGPSPPGQSAGQQQMRSGDVPGRTLFDPQQAFNTKALKSSIRKISPVEPQNQDSVVNPKAFSALLQANPKSDYRGQDHFQSSYFQTDTNLGVAPATLYKEQSNYPVNLQEYFDPNIQFSMSVTLPTTTTQPTSTTSKVNAVNAWSSYFKIPVVNKPADHSPDTQKPSQNKVLEFFSNLINNRGQSNHAQAQTVQQSSSSSFIENVPFSSPNNQWMANANVRYGSSTGTGSGAQVPTHQGGRNNVQQTSTWYVVPPPHSSDYAGKSILHSIQYVNGQLMIPLEKCPGLEKFAAFLRGQGPVHHGQHLSISHSHPHQHVLTTHSHPQQHVLTTHSHPHHHFHTTHSHPQHGHTGHVHPPHWHTGHVHPPHVQTSHDQLHQYIQTSHGHDTRRPSSEVPFRHHSSSSHGHFNYLGAPSVGQVLQHHGPGHQHPTYSPPSGHMSMKPPSAQIFLKLEGTATSPTESQTKPTDAYQGRWGWQQNAFSGGSQYPRVDQTNVYKEHDQPDRNYVVQIGANVGLDKPESQAQLPYATHRRH